MTYAILLSGGIGIRLGGSIPKQYLRVDGEPLFSYCLKTLLKSDKIDGVRIVAAKEWQDEIKTVIDNIQNRNRFLGFSEPGENRQLSIYNALLDMQDECNDIDYVLIHDAARPMLAEETISSLVNETEGHDGAIPVLPMKDTVYQVDSCGRISALLDRKSVVAGQAPEIFVYGKYLDANKRLTVDNNSMMLKINGSTEPAFFAGMDIVSIPGDENNFKVTTMEDLERFISIIKSRG